MDKILELIAKYKKTLSDYKKAFMASGGISAEEQAILDKVEAQIKKLEELIEVYKAEKTVMPTINEPVAKDATPKSFGPSPDEIDDTDDWEKLVIDWLIKNEKSIAIDINPHIPSPNNLRVGLSTPIDSKTKEKLLETRFDSTVNKLKQNYEAELKDISDSEIKNVIEKWAKDKNVLFKGIDELQKIEKSKKAIHIWLNTQNTPVAAAIKTESTSGGTNPIGDIQKFNESFEEYIDLIIREVEAAKELSKNQIWILLKEYLESKDSFFQNLPTDNKEEYNFKSLESALPKLSKKPGFKYGVKGKKLYIETNLFKVDLSGSSKRELSIDLDGNLLKIENKVKTKLDIGTKLNFGTGSIDFKFNIDAKGTWGYKIELTSKGSGYLSKKAANQIEFISDLIDIIIEEIYSGEFNQGEIDSKIKKIEGAIKFIHDILQEEIKSKGDIVFWIGEKSGKNPDIQIGFKYNF